VTKEISTRDFVLLSGYIREISGIDLDETKRYLVESRLGPLIEKSGCADYACLYAKIREDASGTLRASLVNAITTHETSFFRDRKPFDLIRLRLIPSLIANDPRRPVRIWSAACSTGQEAYSLAMLLLDSLGDPGRFDIRILGTDISEESVRAARAGEYRDFEVSRGIPPEKLDRYFTRKDGGYQVIPALRDLVEFRRGNILEPEGSARFDIILCRNVAIYFSMEDRKRLFEGLAGSLKPEGCLFIGASESLMGVTARFIRREELGAAYYTLGQSR
jgi:chemotaxis protein methyltransferase CheR